jgi:hypothetical protein
MLWLHKYNWLFPLLILATLLLGTIGFYQYSIANDTPPDWFSSLYLSLQLFVLNSGGVPGTIPLTLEISRFLAPALTAGGIFLAIWRPLHQNWLLFKIRFWKDHVVVCGLSKKAELLIFDFLQQRDEKYKIILIETNEDHPAVSFMRKKGVIVLHDPATDLETLQKANVLHARYLLALTNDEKVNIHIAQKVTNLFNQHPEQLGMDRILQVIIHIDDFYTTTIFKEFHEKAVPDNARFKIAGSRIDYHAFSIYQLAAMFMVDSFSPDKYVSLNDDHDPPAHLLILGNNLAAQYLILEAAQMYHFANLKKSVITVVADEVKGISQRIESLYPFLDETVQVNYLETGKFFSEFGSEASEEIAVCFVALDDDGQSVYYSRKLRQFLYNQHRKVNNGQAVNMDPGAFAAAHPPIKVLLPRNTALVNIFDDVSTEMASLNIELINMDHEICNKRTIVDNRKTEDFIAKHIHYEWARTQAARTNSPIGTMQEEWEKIKDAQKDSNRLPARHLYIKLRYVNAELSDVTDGEELDFNTLDKTIWDRIARMEHNRWVAEKSINGFVQIDPVRDKVMGQFLKQNLKCHWDLVPFDDLDTATQEYDTFTFRMAPVIAHLNHKRIMKSGIGMQRVSRQV